MTLTSSSNSDQDLIHEALNLTLVTGRPGVGKSEYLLNKVLQEPGLYVIAQPRQDLIEETKARLLAKTSLSNCRPEIIVIHGTNKPDPKRSVSSLIKTAPKDYGSLHHVVVFTTHEGIMSSDMSGFTGWQMLMDEVANPIKSKSLAIPVVAKQLSEYITLEPTGCHGWSNARLRSDAPSQGHIHLDKAFKELAELFKIMRSQRTLWLKTTDLMEFYFKPRKLRWFTYWDLRMLSAFDSITVAGAGFKNSILCKAMGASLNIKELPVVRPQTGSPKVKVRYFTRGHRSSTEFWKATDGIRCLKAVADFYAKDPDTSYYWSANGEVDKVIQSSMKGLSVRPKQEGTNTLMSYRRCVFLYSSKMLPEDQPTSHILNITRSDFEEAREFEDIRQFLMRGAIRDPGFSGEYTIDVYDERQAQMVGEYLQELGLGTAELVPLMEGGIMDVMCFPSNKSKASEVAVKPAMTREQKRAYNTEYVRQRRAKKKAEEAAAKSQNGAAGSLNP